MRAGPEEALRLLAEQERQLPRRLRRAADRLAYRAWRLLPAASRDVIRPLLLPTRTAPTRPPRPAPAARRRAQRTVAPVQLPPISLLIPTLDGGRDFELLLAAIARQEAVGELELVVVDSGSADGTPDAAERSGARVVSIPRNEFGHGRTRNLAAEVSTGSVLVLLVQDALLLGRTAVRDLVAELLADDGLAAVSARHVPRSDADLYGAFVVYAHERAVRRPQTAWDRARAEASVDDVCAAVRREAWDEVRFADVPFAEDIDFGVRAREHGWALRQSARVAVAHSHTRPAAYHLRRHVADRLYVAPLVGDGRVPRAADQGAADLLPAARAIFAEVEAAVSVARDGEASLGAHLSRVRSALQAGAPRVQPSGELVAAAELLADETSAEPPERLVRELRRDIVRLVGSEPVQAFAAAHRHVASGAAGGFAAKAAAAVVGRAIGDALRLQPDDALAARLLTGI
jgi:GT2 family glycosyltransferase